MTEAPFTICDRDLRHERVNIINQSLLLTEESLQSVTKIVRLIPPSPFPRQGEGGILGNFKQV